MIRIIAIALLSAGLAGCILTGKKSGDFVAIKPNALQLQSAVRAAVCDSFRPITFSKAADSADTVSQVRGHNAAIGAYKCP